MKTIVKVFIVLLLVGCCNDDDSKETEVCLTEDLGITADYKNPFPELYTNYVDWKWTIINDSILRVKTEEVYYGQLTYPTEYYYFTVDSEKKCLTFLIAKYRTGSDVEIGDEIIGEVVYPESSDFTLELQYWEENDKFIGRIKPNDPNPLLEVEKRSFWVELTDENYEPQSEWEEYLGL